jgi:hypothetical protein
MILPRRQTSKNSVSLVKARDDVFSVVKTQSMLSFRSGCVPNATSTDVCVVAGKDCILTPERVKALEVSGLFGTR